MMHWSNCWSLYPYSLYLLYPVLCLDLLHMPDWALATMSSGTQFFSKQSQSQIQVPPISSLHSPGRVGVCQHAEHLAQRFEGCVWAPCLGQLPTPFPPLPSFGMKVMFVERVWGNTMLSYAMESQHFMPPWSPVQRTAMQFYQYWLWQWSPLTLKCKVQIPDQFSLLSCGRLFAGSLLWYVWLFYQ